jgi:arylsulfatase A-like enzyme
MLPLLGGADFPFREDWFYEHHFRSNEFPIERTEGVRGRRWKYIRYLDQTPNYEQLFDLEADPQENRNLAAAPGYGPKLRELRARWRFYRKNLR